MQLRKAEWRPAIGHPGYEVSNSGKVRSRMGRNGRPLRLLRPGRTAQGYLSVALHGISRTVHSLVLEAFVGPRPPGCDVSHLDGTRDNNRLENLQWETRKANMARAIVHGTIPRGEGRRHILTADDVGWIRHEYTGERGQIKALAAHLGVSRTTVADVINGRTWVLG